MNVTACPACHGEGRVIHSPCADCAGSGTLRGERKLEVKFPAGVSDRAQFAAFAQLSVMQNFYYPYLLFVDPAGQVRSEHQGSERAWFGEFEINLLKTIDSMMQGGAQVSRTSSR